MKHFISKPPNDVFFVATVWKMVFQELELQQIRIIHVWSDGGPKHFKLSAHLYFWWLQLTQGLSLQVTLNFFEVTNIFVSKKKFMISRHIMATMHVMLQLHTAKMQEKNMNLRLTNW